MQTQVTANKAERVITASVAISFPLKKITQAIATYTARQYRPPAPFRNAVAILHNG